MNQKEGNNQEKEKPQIWHYGLVTRDWAEFLTEGGEEADYFKKIIETSGQPALDVGCGSGRLLVPLLQAGLAHVRPDGRSVPARCSPTPVVPVLESPRTRR